MPKIVQPIPNHPAAKRAAIANDKSEATKAANIPALRDVLLRVLARQEELLAEIEKLKN